MKSLLAKIASSVAAVLVIAGAAAAQNEVKLPSTAAGKTLAEFMKAFNTGDLETLKKFHRDRGGSEENANKDLEAFKETGGLKIHKVKKSSELEIEVLAQSNNGGEWLSFYIKVDAEAPHQIQEIRVMQDSAP